MEGKIMEGKIMEGKIMKTVLHRAETYDCSD